MCGFFLSLGIFVTVIAYASNKGKIMVDYGDTKHQTTILKNALNIDEQFGYEKLHFNVAVGFIDPFKKVGLQDDSIMKWSANMLILD